MPRPREGETEAELLDRVSQGVESDEGGGGEPAEIEVGAPVTDEERKSRQEKRAERPGLMQALEEQRETVSRLEREREADRREMENLRRQVEAAQQRDTGAPDGKSRHEAELERLDAEAESLLEAFNAKRASGKLTDEEYRSYNKRFREVNRKQQTLLAEQVLERAQQSTQVSPEEQRSREISEGLRAQWPDVYRNRRAVFWANGRYHQLLAEDVPPEKATVQAHNEARARFNTGAPAADPKMRRKLAGEGRASSGDGGPKRVKVTPHLREMALEHYSHLDNLTDEQKVQKLVNEVPGLAK